MSKAQIELGHWEIQDLLLILERALGGDQEEAEDRLRADFSLIEDQPEDMRENLVNILAKLEPHRED